MAELEVDVCIAGGGPAGATLGRRLAGLGHRVVLIERAASAAGRPGESLAPGILPVLAAAGVGEAVAAAGFLRPAAALVRWADDRAETHRRGETPGFQIDRGRFDALLLAAAEQAGATVWRPAQALRPVRGDGGGWRVAVRAEGSAPAPGSDRCADLVRARFIVDATGRQGWLPGRRQRDAAPLVALTAHFGGVAVASAASRVEAQAEGWLWGAPLPGGSFSAMAFSDPAATPARGQREAALLARLGDSELLGLCAGAALLGPVVARDASALHREEPVGEDWIRIGDASFTVDPLSSQGVQAAMASALHAAVVVHTLLAEPAHAQAARRFYRERQVEAIERHRDWAAQLYAERRPSLGGAFWRARAAAAERGPDEDGAAGAEALPEAPVRLALRDRLQLAPEAAIAMIPRVERDLVVLGQAVTHPRLPRPVAYLGGVELAPLLGSLGGGGDTVGGWLTRWAPVLSASGSRELLAWLLRHRIVIAS